MPYQDGAAVLGYCLALSGCGMRLRDPAARYARVVQETSPRKIRGRRECRVRAAPAVSCAKCTKKTHTSIQVSGGTSASPAQWLYGLCRALPGDEFVLSPSSAD